MIRARLIDYVRGWGIVEYRAALRRLASPAETAVDCGCGTGAVLREVMRVARPKVAIAVDVSPACAAAARGLGAQPVLADFGAGLPVAAASVDLVLAAQVLELAPDWTSLVHTWVRVLRPGGVLLLSTPNPRSFRNRLLGRLGIKPPALKRPLPSGRALRTGLTRMGFRVEAMRSVGFTPLPPPLCRLAAAAWPAQADHIVVRARLGGELTRG